MQKKMFDHGYALLVGVGTHCHEPRLSLPVTVNDVAALQKTLQAPDLCAYRPEHIQPLLNQDASNSKIIAGLNWLISQVASDPEATVVIYYSGHGWVSPDGKYYLITQDTTPGAVQETSLASKVFTSMLRKLRAERVLIVLDCCHAEGMAEAKGLSELDEDLAKGLDQNEGAPQDVVQTLAEGIGRAVFSSSRGDEKSYFYADGTLSVFTYHFIEALQGAGHRPGDTTVTIASLMKYVSSAVPDTVEKLYRKSQHPFFKFEATDFPVALIQGGKGLPASGWSAIKANAERYLFQLTGDFISGDKVQGDKIGQQTNTSGGAHFGGPIIAPQGTIIGGDQNVNVGGSTAFTASGAIAQGIGSVAVGSGGVAVGGTNFGSINTGTHISGDLVRGDKVLGDKISGQINTSGGAIIFGDIDTRGGTFNGRDQIRGGGANTAVSARGAEKLAVLLSEFFSSDELKRLATDLGISWQDLVGESIRERALDLVQLCEARGRLDEIRRLLRWARPNLLRFLD